MITLVANLGSTSFKYKLYDMPRETLLATGAADRIGQGDSAWEVELPDGREAEGAADLADHAAAIDLHMAQLRAMGITQIDKLAAIGFKAVHGGPISGAVPVDDAVLATMEQFADVAPAHNPPYIAAMRAFMAKLPDVPQVAAFETAFHQTVPMSRQVYAIPYEWTEMGVRRYGFHGASHRYIATRMAAIAPQSKRVISLHLGGSCSICAIKDGQSVASSFGMTVQTGVFHNNRVGDFDTFALLKIMKQTGDDLNTIFRKLGKEGGMAGISGVSPDMRKVEEAAAAGNARAQLALDAFVESCRHYVGAYLVALGGADAIVFTGGIGQAGKEHRAAVLANLEFAGIVLDTDKNMAASRKDETAIHAAGSKTQIWVLPTNEELIVARQTHEVLK